MDRYPCNQKTPGSLDPFWNIYGMLLSARSRQGTTEKDIAKVQTLAL